MIVLVFYYHSLIVLTVFALFLLFFGFFVIGWSGEAYLAIFRPYLEKFEKNLTLAAPIFGRISKSGGFFIVLYK